MNTAGVVALVVALIAATAVGLVLRRRDGRARTGGTASGGWALAGRAPGAERVLLLQLSSPICTPCRQTAAVLTEMTARTAGLAHVEVDVAEQPDVARALNVLRTPTVVAFDRSGEELLRLSGVPRVADLDAALAPALATP